MRECPASCGLCVPGCHDLSLHCHQWASEGECVENRDFMLKECPVSCGVCTVPCEDRTPQCDRWAEEGRCTRDPDFVLRVCPAACGVCALTCHDRRLDCAWWPGGPAMRTPTTCASAALARCAIKTAVHGRQRHAVPHLGRVGVSQQPRAARECMRTCGACTRLCVDRTAAAASGRSTASATATARRCTRSAAELRPVSRHRRERPVRRGGGGRSRRSSARTRAGDAPTPMLTCESRDDATRPLIVELVAAHDRLPPPALTTLSPCGGRRSAVGGRRSSGGPWSTGGLGGDTTTSSSSSLVTTCDTESPGSTPSSFTADGERGTPSTRDSPACHGRLVVRRGGAWCRAGANTGWGSRGHRPRSRARRARSRSSRAYSACRAASMRRRAA